MPHVPEARPAARLAGCVLRGLPLLAISAVILYSGLKPEPVPQVFDQQDKLHHLAGFAAFAFTLYLAFAGRRMGWGLLASVGLGLGIELLQGLQPHRDASLGDMAANTLGAVIGWGCWLGFRAWLWRRRGAAAPPAGGTIENTGG